MKLFLRIFLSFWVATVLMLVAVIGVSEFSTHVFRGDGVNLFEPEVAASVLANAVNEYERRGAEAFLSDITINHNDVYLIDEHNRVLAKSGSPPPFYLPMARGVLQSGHSQILRLPTRLVFACPIDSATGQHYAVILTVGGTGSHVLRPRFWFNLAIAMLPMSLVCMALALYITRPITKLQEAARRLSGGDLGARCSPGGTVRRDELGDLARDFDGMAAQIQLLMTAQRRFVADVSHELGAPLTRMHLALALLRRQLNGKAPEELERIDRETDKLSNLVRQLLLLAGLEAGVYPAENLTPVAIRSFCESIVQDHGFEASQSNRSITATVQDLTVMAYPQLLRRAIDNVLRNATRYSPSGSEVLLNGWLDPNAQEVVLEVMDSGPGVPESMLSDIFRPFFRTAPGREATSGGTGLGLSIAREAILRHDGTIIARNREGSGLLISIRFPAKTVPAGQDRSTAEAAEGV